MFVPDALAAAEITSPVLAFASLHAGTYSFFGRRELSLPTDFSVGICYHAVRALTAISKGPQDLALSFSTLLSISRERNRSRPVRFSADVSAYPRAIFVFPLLTYVLSLWAAALLCGTGARKNQPRPVTCAVVGTL